MKNKTYFGNKITLNRQIWVAKTIKRSADTNTTILDLSKEQIMPLPKIVLKSQSILNHCFIYYLVCNIVFNCIIVHDNIWMFYCGHGAFFFIHEVCKRFTAGTLFIDAIWRITRLINFGGSY